MPQTFVAVQCAFCHVFQGSLDKKNKKFACAVCGQKQSFRHVHAVGNCGKDIRVVVQQLNELRGAHEQAVGDVDGTKASLPQHLGCAEQQQAVQWDDFAEPACDRTPGNDWEDGDPYVTALPNTAGGSRGRTANVQRSKRQKLQQEDATGCQYGHGGPAGWLDQTKPSSKVAQPLPARPPRPPLQQQKLHQQSSQSVDHNDQGLQATSCASWQANSNQQGLHQQQHPSAAAQQPQQQYQQQYSSKQGQHTQHALWGSTAASPRLQQNQMQLPQQQQGSAGGLAAGAGASRPQQLPGRIAAAQQQRPCDSRQRSISQDPQQREHGSGVWPQHNKQQEIMQHNPSPASRFGRPPLMQQQQHMKPPSGCPAQLQKQAQQRKPAAASSSPWRSFVDEDDAAAYTSDDDADDVDEQGFCNAVPAYASGAGQHARGVMVSKWV